MVLETTIITIAGWLISPILSRAVDRLQSHLAGNLHLTEDAREKLDELVTALLAARAAIGACEGRVIRDPATVHWVRRLKDAAYEADDVLDALESVRLQLQVRLEVRPLNLFRDIRHILRNARLLPDDVLKKLEKILENLKKIVKDEIPKMRKGLGGPKYSETCASLTAKVFGQDTERQNVLKMLLPIEEPESSNIAMPLPSKDPESSNLAISRDRGPGIGVLPIVGIGGVGKTVLAQSIFANERVVKHFNKMHWIYVSDNLEAREISLKLLGRRRDKGSSLEDIRKDVEAFLKGQRFLIVLDNVCHINCSREWDNLRGFLDYGAEGSMVLVTTQSKTVARRMGNMGPVNLDVLSEEDVWNIFQHYAFVGNHLNQGRMEELRLIRNKIIAKLHGLPLLAKEFGMHFRQNTHWDEILGSELWELDFVSNYVLPSLGLCIEPEMKQCFAYCSVFPEDYIFEKDKLVQMWIAQGFIESKTRIENKGRRWFDELIDQSFFQPEPNSRYKMHNLMREFAVSVSLDECFVVNDVSKNIPSAVRHLTIRTTKKDVLEKVQECRNLRTLLYYSDRNGVVPHIEFKIQHLKCLRVLDLSFNSIAETIFQKDSWSLSHLRYLDLSNTKIRELHGSICELCHLQVLNLQNCPQGVLPRGMNKMISLRHLYADVKEISNIAGIGKLINLQELNEFHVKRQAGHRISELEDLNELHGRLCLLNLQEVENDTEAAKANIKGKAHLDELQLQGNQFTQAILEGLQPHPNLKKLEISGYAGCEPPSWMENNHLLTSLEELKFDNCLLLGRLPANLTSFTSLSKLEIKSSPILKEMYQKEPQGAGWPEINHIPFICVDGLVLQRP